MADRCPSCGAPTDTAQHRVADCGTSSVTGVYARYAVLRDAITRIAHLDASEPGNGYVARNIAAEALAQLGATPPTRGVVDG